MEFVTLIPTAIGVTTTVVGIILTARSTALKTSIGTYKELADSYKEKSERQQEQIDEMSDKVDKLENRLNEVEKIPLRQINQRLGTMDESIAVLLTNQVTIGEKVDYIYSKSSKPTRSRTKK